MLHAFEIPVTADRVNKELRRDDYQGEETGALVRGPIDQTSCGKKDLYQSGKNL